MIQAKKRFGQNFLRDRQILKKMIEQVMSFSPKSVLEIGPGQGALTELLIAEGVKLTAIEIDRDLTKILSERFTDKLTLIEHDVLTVDLKSLHAQNHFDVIIGNLPYNISTPFLNHYEDSLRGCPGLFLVQKEVAERLSAKTGTKDYGRLTLALQQSFDTKMLFDVPPESFHPVPKVNSTFIATLPHHRQIDLPASFDHVVREAFSHRRKTIHNALRSFEIDVKETGIDSTRRPETISFEEFIRIAAMVDAKSLHSAD
jgi:16S rRNA (adenine1518-N6/adenine1519-N6)-dimethyltransferase